MVKTVIMKNCSKIIDIFMAFILDKNFYPENQNAVNLK